MDRNKDVEVFLRGCSIEQALLWVRTAVGPLAGPFEVGDAVVYKPVAGAVVFTSGVDHGLYLSVWFNTLLHPWASDAECARAAARDLGCGARCDPGDAFSDVHPLANVFLEVVAGNERLVTWNS